MNAEERVLSRLTPEDLSIVTIDNVEWLCCFDEENLKIEYGQGGNLSMEDWFLSWNVEALRKFSLSKLTSYTVRTLEPVQMEVFERVKAKLLRAKMYAMNYWENQVYRKNIP